MHTVRPVWDWDQSVESGDERDVRVQGYRCVQNDQSGTGIRVWRVVSRGLGQN